MKARVLVVEDNEDLAENLAELFGDAGASVRTVGTADAAERSANEEPFDIAVVDLGLPAGVSGVELLPRLRDACPEGELVLMTGNASLDTAIEAVRQGVFAYVQKPFDPYDLLAVAERALAQVSLRHERETLSRELAQSEAVHRGVVETVNALILGVGGDDRVEFANPCAVRTLGWRDEDLRGRAFLDVAVEAEGQNELRGALAMARRGEPAEEAQLTVRSGANAQRIVRWHVLPLSNDTGADGVVLAVGHDVTERIELERRTARAEALSAMGELTTGLAHEIRNPLNAAKLQLELLARAAATAGDPSLSSALSERAAIVKQELGRLAELLDEFLELARPREIARSRFELSPLLEEVAALEAPVAEEMGVEISLEGEAGRAALGDRAKVMQILVNLVGNALEALRAEGGGHVVLATADGGAGMVRIEVTDDGPGLAPDVSERVFEPFVTTKEAGTGLGLSIVKKIVELHGGEAHIETLRSRGTRAWFTLPSA